MNKKWILILFVMVSGCIGARNDTMSLLVDSKTRVQSVEIRYEGMDSQYASTEAFGVLIERAAHQPEIDLDQTHLAVVAEKSLTVGFDGKTKKRDFGDTKKVVQLEKKTDDLMKELDELFTKGDQNSSPCLSLVKVIIGRTDGTLEEKSGCRGQKWLIPFHHVFSESLLLLRDEKERVPAAVGLKK